MLIPQLYHDYVDNFLSDAFEVMTLSVITPTDVA
jgi:hypothetical protein